MNTTMLTKNTTELRTLVEQHVAADQVIQGTYWNADEHRGCFIGCLNHSDDPAGAEKRFGLPIMVQRIAESIFESLPPNEAKLFFASLPDAVGCDGKDLSRVSWQFLAAELRALPEVPAHVQAVVDPVIAGLDLLASGQEWPDAVRADRAARAARATTDAASNAAWATANAANIAADAAADAANAAWATANAANIAADAAADAADRAAWAAEILAVASTAWGAARAAGAATRAASNAAWATANAADAANAAWATANAADAARAAEIAARQRQRDLLLRLIAEAPMLEVACEAGCSVAGS